MYGSRTRIWKARNFVVVCFSVITLFVFVAPAAQAQERLRIVTYNAEILAAPGTWASRLTRFRWDRARRRHFEQVAAIVETLNPDVLNLVEVTSIEGVELLVQILHEKGLKKYRGYHVESHDDFTGMDVALITKIEPDEIAGENIRCLYSPPGEGRWSAEYTYIDKAGTRHRRNTALKRSAVYYLTVGRHKLGFLGLHLKANPENVRSNALRTAEAKIARRIIRDEIVARGYTPIVLGDLNDYDADVPDRDDSRSPRTRVLPMLKHYDDSAAGPKLVNVAERIVRRADRFTSHWDRNENGAEDPGDVFTMLDYILLHKSLMPGVRRAFIAHGCNSAASDHWPVVVDLELETNFE